VHGTYGMKATGERRELQRSGKMEKRKVKIVDTGTVLLSSTGTAPSGLWRDKAGWLDRCLSCVFNSPPAWVHAVRVSPRLIPYYLYFLHEL